MLNKIQPYFFTFITITCYCFIIISFCFIIIIGFSQESKHSENALNFYYDPLEINFIEAEEIEMAHELISTLEEKNTCSSDAGTD